MAPLAGGDKVEPDREGFEALVQRQWGNADKAMGTGGERGAQSRWLPVAIGLLNVESRFPVSRLVEAPRRR